jgi:broad specificity phosphatase PhoE
MEITKRSDLREINVGVWQNVLFKEVQEKYPETFKKYISNPGVWTFEGGECYADVQKRALHALEEIAAENEGKTVVIGTHGGLIRALRAAWEGIPLSEFKKVPNISNCSVTVVEYSNGSVKLLSIGNTEHLTGNNAIV